MIFSKSRIRISTTAMAKSVLQHKLVNN